MHPHAIKHYKTLLEQNGEYREYFVYPEEGEFVFECWDNIAKNDGTDRGGRKVHQICGSLEEAVSMYEDFIEKWEDSQERKKCPQCGSDSIKQTESEDDFADNKPEGAPASKAKNKIAQRYYCHSCQY